VLTWVFLFACRRQYPGSVGEIICRSATSPVAAHPHLPTAHSQMLSTSVARRFDVHFDSCQFVWHSGKTLTAIVSAEAADPLKNDLALLLLMCSFALRAFDRFACAAPANMVLASDGSESIPSSGSLRNPRPQRSPRC
jgi:hypothetical protein